MLQKPKQRKGDGPRTRWGASLTDRARVPDRLWVVADGLPAPEGKQEHSQGTYRPSMPAAEKGSFAWMTEVMANGPDVSLHQ